MREVAEFPPRTPRRAWIFVGVIFVLSLIGVIATFK